MAHRFVWRCWTGLALAQAVLVQADYISTDTDLYNTGALGHRPHLEFRSSDEYAPLLQINTWSPDAISTTGSHIFLKHDGNDSSPLSSPLILDARDLSAVYMNRSFTNVFGTRVQEDRGKKYLTFWAGDKGDGIGDGYGLAFDDTYRLAYKVSAQDLNGVHADLHEFALAGNGTALVTGVNRIRMRGDDFREIYGWDYPLPDGLEIEILDGVVQEIDLETNEVLFDWRALEHVNPLDSYEPMGRLWDAYHVNSIEKTQAGNYLVSIRHTHSIHLIHGTTGAIIWTLGGAQNDFAEVQPPNATNSSSPIQQPLLTMAWQHHARLVPGTNESQMTFFDNHVKTTSHGECRTNCSRGLHVALDTAVYPPTAQLLREFVHPVHLQAQSQGSVQVLDASQFSPSASSDVGNVFIGWGRCPTFTEHTATGETVLDVQFSPWHSADIPDALDNYRAYKMDWVAMPWWDPEVALAWRQSGEDEDGDGDEGDSGSSNSTLVVYASWNGATEVAGWVLRGRGSVVGEEDDDEEEEKEVLLVASPRTGFETELTIAYEETYRYLWAEALDAQGDVLRSSEIIDLDATGIRTESYNSAVSAELGLKSSSSLLNKTNTKKKPTTNARARGLSSTALALLGAGSGILMLMLIIASGVMVFIRRRRRVEYKSLEASDFDLGPVDDDDDEEEKEDQGDRDAANRHGEADQGLEQSRRSEDEDRRALLPSTKGCNDK
ncbi:ASST-domain-containing protein [Aspergillus pseudodeflectus]|uniref:ASST-domain-containing protein n=1 Tax=Aspergillus pseudodeflectus TaxID=176178 RepID=A0ABR4JW18_9EURO